MPVPTSFSDLDTVAANNPPPGTETAKGNIDNYLRAAFSFIKTLYTTKAASGANTDITSLGAVTGVTAAQFDNTAKLTTSAYVRSELLGLGNAVYSAIFGATLASSGYQKLPGGLIVQWGLSTATVAGTANTFPIAFPNSAFQVLHTESNGGTALTSLSTSAPTTTGFTGYASTGPVSTAYVAFGK